MRYWRPSCSPTDLQSLLLSLAQTRARQIRPAEALRRWRSDRFVRPATIDPARLSEVEHRLWQRLRDTAFVGLALSPVTPLGTCTAVGAVDQNRIVSTVRSSEAVSDPCNVLALEAALRRRSGADQVHLASYQRVLRGQQFTQGIGYYRTAAFKIMANTKADELEIGDGGFVGCPADSECERALSDLVRGPGAACRSDARLSEEVFPEFWDRPDRAANLTSLP